MAKRRKRAQPVAPKRQEKRRIRISVKDIVHRKMSKRALQEFLRKRGSGFHRSKKSYSRKKEKEIDDDF